MIMRGISFRINSIIIRGNNPHQNFCRVETKSIGTYYFKNIMHIINDSFEFEISSETNFVC